MALESSQVFLYITNGVASRKLCEQISDVKGITTVRQYSDSTGKYHHLLQLNIHSYMDHGTVETILQSHELSGHVSMPVNVHNNVAVSDAGFDAIPLTIITHRGTANTSIKVLTMGVQGMVCMNCVNIIENNISKISGVSLVTASLEQNSATIEYDSHLITEHQMKDAIEDLGFEVTLHDDNAGNIDTTENLQDSIGGSNKTMDSLNSVSTVRLGITGMKCHSCVNMIENGVMDVLSVKVFLEKNEATVTFDSRHCSMIFRSVVKNLNSALKQ